MTKLILVPSKLELDMIASTPIFAAAQTHGVRWELCGVGILNAARRSTEILLSQAFDKVLLLGVAGGFAGAMEPTEVGLFESARLFGIGIGDGNDFIPADRSELSRLFSHPVSYSLDACPGITGPVSRGQIVTACSISASPAEADRKRIWNPEALAEDLEAYAVAEACHAAGVPLTVLRGISNVVGNRNRQDWRIREAIEAMCCFALAELSQLLAGRPV